MCWVHVSLSYCFQSPLIPSPLSFSQLPIHFSLCSPSCEILSSWRGLSLASTLVTGFQPSGDLTHIFQNQLLLYPAPSHPVWHPLGQWSVRSSLDSRKQRRADKAIIHLSHLQRTQRKSSVPPCLLLEVINSRGKSYILSGAHVNFSLLSHMLSNFTTLVLQKQEMRVNVPGR